jgi:hypothetical protein
MILECILETGCSGIEDLDDLNEFYAPLNTGGHTVIFSLAVYPNFYDKIVFSPKF